MNRVQKIALYLFFFSINFEVWDPFHTNGFFSVSKLTGYFYLLTMISLITKFITNTDLKPLLKPIWLFFGLLTIVSLFNISPTYYNFFDFSIFQNIILFYILINHERYDPLILEKGMLSFSIGSMVLAILFIAGIGIGTNADGRITIFGDNQNTIGVRMSISMIILALAIIQNRLHLGNIRYLFLILIPIMLQLMSETGSRVAVISFILSFLAGGILLGTKNIWRKILVLGIGTLALIFVWQFFMQNELLRSRLLLSVQEGDLSERDIIWARLLPLIRSNPVFGVGETGYANYAHSVFGQFISPHNVLLEVLCLTGITGLIIYLVFIYRIFKKSLQIYKRQGFLMPLLLMVPVMGLLLSGQILYLKTGWIIFAYIVSCQFLTDKTKSDKQKSIRVNEDSLHNR